ncbi:uncharacterized protein G2W53_004403 [Senna tora]|uniref:Uncharacterized protein n=1 Tax=Senna tora TaxID=362788 RepID=A0A834XCS9_9FABA|nr:uncharacterized protein G2W53_004403 [Senna tora]
MPHNSATRILHKPKLQVKPPRKAPPASRATPPHAENDDSSLIRVPQHTLSLITKVHQLQYAKVGVPCIRIARPKDLCISALPNDPTSNGED